MAKGSSGIPTDNLRAAVGIVALLSCAWVLSESRRSISWRKVGLGLGLTVALVVLLLKVPPIRTAFALVNNAVDAVAVAGAPAAILISQIMVPEQSESRTAHLAQDPEPVAASTTDAIVKGTTVGLELLLNVTAMLIVFIALVHLANAALGLLPEAAGLITLQRVLGLAMAPLCWLMGVPWPEAVAAGALMGVKTILNEFIAYVQMASLPAEALSPRSRLIMLYALCGFANFGSLGIMIGGLTAVAPSRREEIVALGPRSLIAGTLATCLLGAVVGGLS